MDAKDIEREFKCFGSATVGLKGQVVIPASARKELGINTGDTFLVFKFFRHQGLVLVKADAVEQMLSVMSERLSYIEKLLEDYKVAKSSQERKGVD